MYVSSLIFDAKLRYVSFFYWNLLSAKCDCVRWEFLFPWAQEAREAAERDSTRSEFMSRAKCTYN